MNSPANPTTISRRALLKFAGQAAVLGAAAPIGLQLLSATSAAAMAAPTGYKALVCVFLYGGNDAYNTLVPADAPSHRTYARLRGDLAVPRGGLDGLMIDPSNSADHDHGRRLAFNPSLAPLKSLFDDGQLAVVVNAGTLVRPTTMADYRNAYRLPPKLMSHNDQFSIWQTLLAEGAQTGWGGRLADLALGHNGAHARLSTVSVGRSAAFAAGESASEMSFGADGPRLLDPVTDVPGLDETIRRRLAGVGTSRGLYMAEMSDRYGEATLGGRTVLEEVAGMDREVVGPPEYGTIEPEIYRQLDTVVKVARASDRLQVRRQVFFVSMGGFDAHVNLGTRHPILLAQLGDALAQFNAAIEGDPGLSGRVTTFTASDFGRSLTTNGRGTDHGWGGHHLVMGSSVRSGHVSGQIPATGLGHGRDIGQGRLLPSVGLDQYGATLARWFGLDDTELDTVFPNLVNFPTRDLGFLAG